MRENCLRVGDLGRLRRAVGGVSCAADALLAGRAVVVADTAAGATYLAFAGSRATAETVAWSACHGSGPLHLAMPQVRARASNTASGTRTGPVAGGLARIFALLADPTSRASDVTCPTPVLIEYAAPGGVLVRPRATEAVIDLLRIAGLPGVGALRALVDSDHASPFAKVAELYAFCSVEDAPLVSVQDLVAFRELTEALA